MKILTTVILPILLKAASAITKEFWKAASKHMGEFPVADIVTQ
jgi:hypothetical protein